MTLLLHYLFWGHSVTSFVNTFVFDLYLPFFTSPIIHLLVYPPNLCMEPFFLFILCSTVVPREIKDKAYAKLGGGGGGGRRLTQDWIKNWPTADWPVPNNDSRNNIYCRTHLGSCSLLLSKMVNSA